MPGTRTGCARDLQLWKRWRRRGPRGRAADVCLVPQLYNARRFNVPIDDFPTLLRVEANANALEAFAAAHPDRQEQPK